MVLTDKCANFLCLDFILRVIRFGVVGSVGAAIYFLTLWYMVERFNIPVLVATSISFLWVCLQNYVLHYSWTFRSEHAHGVALPKFLVMNILGFCLNWSVMYLGVKRLELNYLLVQVGATAAVVLWNFLVSSLWIFYEQDEAV
jgi:putative flippase GtrA